MTPRVVRLRGVKKKTYMNNVRFSMKNASVGYVDPELYKELSEGVAPQGDERGEPPPDMDEITAIFWKYGCTVNLKSLPREEEPDFKHGDDVKDGSDFDHLFRGGADDVIEDDECQGDLFEEEDDYVDVETMETLPEQHLEMHDKDFPSFTVFQSKI